MNKSTVVILPCNNYDDQLVYEKLKKGIELIGGLDSLIKKDEKVLVKPNLLKPALPSKAITTHPSIFNGVLRMLQESGYNNLTYGDSSSSSPIEKAIELCGLSDVAKKYNVAVGNFSESVNVNFPGGKYGKKFNLCKGVVEADALISICKMKTHALENITGAVKNQYGCIFSTNKAIGHAKYPNSDIFAKMLVDLNKCVKPRLFIMDGVIAMEGNGPASGDQVPMKVLLISTDPVALDSVFCELVYLNPAYVPTNTNGEKMGLGNMSRENIQIIDESGKISFDQAIKIYGNKDFVVNRKNPSFWRINSLIQKSKPPKHRPVVDVDKCIACGACEDICPVEGKAVISGNGQKAKYDYNKCIRCYCCQESCPAKAISKYEE